MDAILGIIKEAGNKLNASIFYKALIAATKSLSTKPFIEKKTRKKCKLELLYCIKENNKMDPQLAIIYNILALPLMTVSE